MSNNLNYESMEIINVSRPVDRLSYIEDICRDKVVLDVGCLDETAVAKMNTQHWLHGRISSVAKRVVGIDRSESIPDTGIVTGKNAIIFRANITDIYQLNIGDEPFDVIVAGEFIEHLDNPLEFIRNLRAIFPGCELVLSTPNGVSFANVLMGLIGREVQHHDHVANFTYKILNTLCLKAGIKDWQIQPYRFYAVEMIMSASGLKKYTVEIVQTLIRLVEIAFPLLSFGYIVRATL